MNLHRRVLGVHSPGCVYYGQESKPHLETRFSLLLTRLVSRSLEIQFGIRHGAGGFSISEGCGVIFIVDDISGPGFSRFEDAERALHKIFCGEVFSLYETWPYRRHNRFFSEVQPYRGHTTTKQVELLHTTLMTLRRGLCEDFSKGITSANVKVLVV